MERSRRRWIVTAIGALSLAALGLAVRELRRPAPPEIDPPPHAAQGPARGDASRQPPLKRPPDPRARDGARDDPTGEAPEGAEDPRALWEKRRERARHTLDAYLEANRYPPGSRPAREHPDQLRPHHVEPVKLPLARADQKLTDAKVTLRQDRLFLVGDEAATLTIACEDSDGPAPCEVISGVAGLPPSARAGMPGGPPDVPVSFASAGQEGVLSAIFQPSARGFGGYHGTIRISVELKVDAETGGAAFDVQYTPAPPATFTGRVREALQDGSLDLLVEMAVDRPGRYVLAARVDDARGRTFAYLSFNEELGEGQKEARLRLFGKLIRDEEAEPPFRLRDVEGYLLKENTFPDRELMPALLGIAHTTKRYRLSDFSDAAWESEEKDRHVRELSKDVEEAERRLEEAAP